MKEQKQKWWKPKKGGKYYMINNSHVGRGVFKRIWQDSQEDAEYWNDRNCFKSKAEAKFVFKSFNGHF